MSKLKYDESFPERAGEYAAQGLNNTRIARELGIAEDTFYVYLKQFPEFAEAVEPGRRAVRDKVDGGMMALAMGNCFVQTVKHSDNGHETKTIRQRAPDLNAIIRWLEKSKHSTEDGWEDDFVQNADPVVLNIPANFKYDESFPEDAEHHAAAGETDLQIAGRLGISQASFYNYKKQFPDFAAALERGRKECHIRLRRQLLALALGKCTVVSQTYRDGDFRKCTERQLPPNLKAIKYWLADSASREVRSHESEVRMGAGNTEDRNQNNTAQALSISSESGGCPPVASGLYNDRMGETGSAQRLSISSECVESEKSGKREKREKREKQEKWKAGTNENDSAQRDSNSSEWGRSGKGDGNNESNKKNGDKAEKTDDTPARRPSISSESDGCPAGNAGRMGETASVQRDSIPSEYGRAEKGDGKNGSNENNGDKTEKTDDVPAQRPSISSESVGCPSCNAGRMGETSSAQRDSISSEWGRAGKGDGKNGSNENNVDKAEKTDDTPAQRLSKSSESAVSPLRPLCLFRP